MPHLARGNTQLMGNQMCRGWLAVVTIDPAKNHCIDL